jgi:hypothetical protein
MVEESGKSRSSGRGAIIRTPAEIEAAAAQIHHELGCTITAATIAARLSLAAADVNAPTQSWSSTETPIADYWKEIIGESYTPVKHGKHASTHPVTVKRIFDSVRGTEVADVIVGLIFWAAVRENSTRMEAIMDAKLAAADRMAQVIDEFSTDDGWNTSPPFTEFKNMRAALAAYREIGKPMPATPPIHTDNGLLD